MDVIQDVAVERNAAGGTVITWGERYTTQPLRIAVATSPDNFDDASVLTETALAPFEVAAREDRRRCYFRLDAAHVPALVVAERAVPLHGGINFRDLGGYLTAQGRRVKWGRLFRSGHMANFNVADQQCFADLGIGTVCDFRMAEERANEVIDLPGAAQVHVLGIPPGIGDKLYFNRLFASTRDPEDIIAAMHRMLASLVRNAAPFYAPLFDKLLREPAGALLMNCSAGKERTGVAVALVLSALGVPRETILYDFMLSAKYFPALSEVPRVCEKYGLGAVTEQSTALIMPLLATRASFLEAAFAAIDEDHGSTEAFLRASYGLTTANFERLQALYTA